MNLAFFKIPRTASSSISKVLPENISQIRHNDLSNKYLLAEYESSFTFVRHPYDRFVSAYNWIKKGGKKKSSTDQNERKNLLKYKDMDDLCNHIFEFISRCKNPIHFYRQVDWLYQSSPFTQETLLADHVLIYEEKNMEDILNSFLNQFSMRLTQPLPYVNKTKKIELSRSAKEHIYNYYKDDFDVFGFER